VKNVIHFRNVAEIGEGDIDEILLRGPVILNALEQIKIGKSSADQGV
jgi:hypothetical protein